MQQASYILFDPHRPAQRTTSSAWFVSLCRSAAFCAHAHSSLSTYTTPAPHRRFLRSTPPIIPHYFWTAFGQHIECRCLYTLLSQTDPHPQTDQTLPDHRPTNRSSAACLPTSRPTESLGFHFVPWTHGARSFVCHPPARPVLLWVDHCKRTACNTPTFTNPSQGRSLLGGACELRQATSAAAARMHQHRGKKVGGGVLEQNDRVSEYM
jgi:hypothetical protein